MRHTQRGMDRMVNFSDAIVAVAITLLALPLVDVVSEGGGQGVWEVLSDNWFSILAFLISFAVIARFWMGHHQLYEQIKDYNASLLWANVLWLATIVVFPVTTEWVTSTDSLDSGAVALYIGTMLVATLAMTLQAVILRRHPELRREDHPDDLALMPFLVVCALFALSLLIAVFDPFWGMCSLILLATAGLIEAVLAAIGRRIRMNGASVVMERTHRHEHAHPEEQP